MKKKKEEKKKVGTTNKKEGSLNKEGVKKEKFEKIYTKGGKNKENHLYI